MITIRLHTAVRRELHRAIDWYVQEAGRSIAASLLEDFEHLQTLIREHPQIGAPDSHGMRKMVFKRFPYTLIYRLKGDTAEILAVAHHSRHPEYWSGRL